jgi:AcrR family transcriptional regulator
MTAVPAGRERIVNRTVERGSEARRERALDAVERIMDAARAIAVEQGRTSFTVQQVVERAGIALQTFYRHFRSKDEMLLAVFEEAMLGGTERIHSMAAPYADPVARLKEILTNALRLDADASPLTRELVVREHLRLYDLYPREIETSLLPFRQIVANTIREAQATGLFPGVDADIEAEIIHHLVISRFHMQTLGAFTSATDDIAEQMWDFCLGALRRGGHGR